MCVWSSSIFVLLFETINCILETEPTIMDYPRCNWTISFLNSIPPLHKKLIYSPSTIFFLTNLRRNICSLLLQGLNNSHYFKTVHLSTSVAEELPGARTSPPEIFYEWYYYNYNEN